MGLPDDFDVNDWAGFVYLITKKDTGKKYVGRKYFFTERKKPKKAGVKKRELVKKESDWKTYCSSCKQLKEDIDRFGEELFKFEIIGLYKTKEETNYAEVKEQFTRDVLNSRLPSGEREYYNNNILSRYFAPKDI